MSGISMVRSAVVRRLHLRLLFSASPTGSISAFKVSGRHLARGENYESLSAASINHVLVHRKANLFRCHFRGTHSDVKLESSTRLKDKDHPSQTWKIKMLYDGECPLCMREVNMLKERNNHYGAIKFVDISSKDYSPKENEGLDYGTAMGRIHAVLSDGTILRDVDAFRRLYEEVGLGWVFAITKYEPIATIANAVYKVWAKYRLPIVGRPSLEAILKLRERQLADEACSDNVCKKDPHPNQTESRKI